MLINEAIAGLPGDTRFRLLLSAHGLPKRVVAAGDPYQAQVERTAADFTVNVRGESIPKVEVSDWGYSHGTRAGLRWPARGCSNATRSAREFSDKSY